MTCIMRELSLFRFLGCAFRLLGFFGLVAGLHGKINMHSVSTRKVMCVNEHVNIEWMVDDWDGGSELVWISVQDLSLNQTVARFDVFQYASSADDHHHLLELSSTLDLIDRVPESLQRFHSIIHCRLDGPSKVPKIRTARWTSVDGHKTLILTFSEPTNAVPLDNPIALNNALVFNHGKTQLNAGYGTWGTDGLVLTISGIDSVSWDAVVASMVSGTFHSMPRTKLLVGEASISPESLNVESTGTYPVGNLQGNFSMRLTSPGRLVAHLHLRTERISSINNLDVSFCPYGISIPQGRAASNAIQTCASSGSCGNDHGRSLRLSNPFFAVEGVLAMSGETWLEIPGYVFPARRVPLGGDADMAAAFTPARHNSWTLAFWIFPLQEPGESYHHRPLFHRADASGSDHKLSAWIRANSNNVVLRAMANVSESINDIEIPTPLKTWSWNHLVFSVEASEGETSSMSVFINGSLATSTTVHAMSVTGTKGLLRIGRELDNNGLRMLVSLIRMWDSTLAADQVSSIYQESKALFDGGGSRALRSRFPAEVAVADAISRFISDPRESDIIKGFDGSPGEQSLRDSAYDQAALATALCKPFAKRLELYKSASNARHADGHLRYASLTLTGREEPEGAGAECGREREPSESARAEAVWKQGGTAEAVGRLKQAVRQGSPRAAFMLATLILTGVARQNDTNPLTSLQGGPRTQALRNAFSLQLAGAGVGAAVQDQVANALQGDSGKGTVRAFDTSTTAEAVGLLHIAAAGGHAEAQLALGLRYLEGYGVQRDPESAAWYMQQSAQVAYEDFHVPGKQPIIEDQRLTEANEASVAVGQQGEDDDAIQFQTQMAKQGHVPSQVALGELYYWGARGVPRNQTKALEYFNIAAKAGDNGARCGAAGMYMKGEGAEANYSRAVELYELAAAEGHVRALNGLGYEYFHGHVLPTNTTKAFEYFRRAASMRQDGDSLFNAGYCLATGTGVEMDTSSAVSLFRLGASWGHVDCAYHYGSMSMQGSGLERNPSEAAKNFLVVAQVGPWARGLRTAFDCYLKGDMVCALSLYSLMAELGYEVASSNAAFLLDRGKIAPPGERRSRHRSQSGILWGHAMAVRFHIMSATKGCLPSYVALGDAFFYGQGGLPRDFPAACWWYSRASAAGVVRASYSLGYMHELGLGVPRDYTLALMHYDRARQNARAGTVVTDLNQGLDGTPVELLIFLAKIRLFFNRYFGNLLGKLTQDTWHEKRYKATRYWTLGRTTPGDIPQRASQYIRWLTTPSTDPHVLSSRQGVAPDADPTGYSPGPNFLDSIVTAENATFLALLTSLLCVHWLRRWRRLVLSTSP